MAAVKSVEETAKKWGSVTPQRLGDYQAGVQNPKKDWAANTAAAKDSYKAGVTKAANEGRFEKGVNRAGNQAWKDGVTTKGIDRWGQGVAIGEAKYREGIAPFIGALGSLTLPQRFAKRDPRNLQRVAAVTEAMGRTKDAQSR